MNSILRGMRGHVASYLHEHQQLRASLLRYASKFSSSVGSSDTSLELT